MYRVLSFPFLVWFWIGTRRQGRGDTGTLGHWYMGHGYFHEGRCKGTTHRNLRMTDTIVEGRVDRRTMLSTRIGTLFCTRKTSSLHHLTFDLACSPPPSFFCPSGGIVRSVRSVQSDRTASLTQHILLITINTKNNGRLVCHVIWQMNATALLNNILIRELPINTMKKHPSSITTSIKVRSMVPIAMGFRDTFLGKSLLFPRWLTDIMRQGRQQMQSG